MSQSFKELIVWRHSKDLSLGIYNNFRDLKDYSFRDQIQRAAISVMNNIAEGYARRSDKSFRHFLLISKGSCAEVESMLILALELNYINQQNYDLLIKQIESTGKLLSAFIAKLPATS